MKISIVNSLCVKNDAISASIYDEICWLKEAGHDVRLFAYACDYDTLDFIRVENQLQVLLDPFFQESERIVFHFGVYYNLFDCIYASPSRAKKTVVFHNITPCELLPEKQRSLIRKSFTQLANCAFADKVICVSDVNKTVLNEHGITCNSEVIPLSILVRKAPKNKPSFSDGIIRLLFVGRFVKSKNPIHVLNALEKLAEVRPTIKFECTFIGNTSFSDSEILQEIDDGTLKAHERWGSRINIRLLTNASNDQKWECYEKSDIFVLPSEHEGFCVPVLEALSQGCQVITYDNSNLHYIGGHLTRLVTTNDLEKLFLTLNDVVTIVTSDRWKKIQYEAFTAESEKWLHNFDVDKIKNSFINSINFGS